jgi:hypothetical protein
MLLAAVIAWRLAGGRYPADVETICAAEIRSGFTLRQDMPALGEWVRAHLATPEGNELCAALGDAPFFDRAARLRSEARTLGLAACPLARSYEQLAAEGDARADMQRLCSYVTFPGIEQLDDEARLELVESWIERDAASPGTRALADPLRRADTPLDRARLLRAHAGEIGVLSCDLAKTIESPTVDAGAVDGSLE